MFYIGIDIHQKFIYATVLNNEGKIIQQGKFGTTEAEFDSFLGYLPEKQVKIVIESCGIWEDLYDLLCLKGYSVCLANPLAVKAIASARIKNDKVDSETLAYLLKADLIPESYVPPKEVRELREIVRSRKNLVVHKTKAKNAISTILRRKNLKSPFKDNFTRKGIVFFKTINNPQIFRLLNILDTIENQIKELDKTNANIPTLKKEITLLQTMPGVGEYSARLIASEISDVNRFPSAKKLCNYAGIIPSQNQSWFKDQRGSITKQGSKHLRWILVQCAQVAVRLPGKLQKYYYKLARRKPRSKVIVAVARKMLTIQWHMLKNNEPYIQNHESD